ncbi:MAG: class I SAM-dependent methyltransferase [Candidatus Cloacimonetes bacterium]|jgi:predicted O-methyltransferase YrrM|nr:class I SAM-dependent methyltransferase [Candidatus Cloacimonadota bacterium]MDD4156421.1 class I SAM-dependent methyltransferase [Candidatus Cloacimonadota bacterium]
MEKLISKQAELLKAFKQQAIANNRLWNVNKETAFLLNILVTIKQPKHILEIGTSNGYSTFFLALDNNIQVTTIDVDEKRQSMARDNLQDFTNITFIKAKAEDIIETLDKKIDVLFIDANKPAYINYLKLCEPILNDQALIIADNIDSHPETTSAYHKYVLRDEKYKTIHLSLDAGLLISIYSQTLNI